MPIMASSAKAGTPKSSLVQMLLPGAPAASPAPSRNIPPRSSSLQPPPSQGSAQSQASSQLEFFSAPTQPLTLLEGHALIDAFDKFRAEIMCHGCQEYGTYTKNADGQGRARVRCRRKECGKSRSLTDLAATLTQMVYDGAYPAHNDPEWAEVPTGPGSITNEDILIPDANAAIAEFHQESQALFEEVSRNT